MGEELADWVDNVDGFVGMMADAVAEMREALDDGDGATVSGCIRDISSWAGWISDSSPSALSVSLSLTSSPF